jgi:hypothetical protein
MRGFMKASYALAFERVSVRPSQTQHVRFTLSAHDLGMVNEEGARLAAAGDSKRFVGGSQFGTGAARNRTAAEDPRRAEAGQANHGGALLVGLPT